MLLGQTGRNRDKYKCLCAQEVKVLNLQTEVHLTMTVIFDQSKNKCLSISVQCVTQYSPEQQSETGEQLC